MSGIPLLLAEQWLRESGHLAREPISIGAPIARSFLDVCVDSRLARQGCLFVALPGTRTDGHEYIDHACRGGAVAALVSQERLSAVQAHVFGSITLFAVDDPLAALQTIALRWRRRHPSLRRIGITGSNGKTTTKELVAAILSRHAATVHSRGNFNSDIGLPMELLRIRPEHRYGVFEMGMNRVGEIGVLARLTEPDIAIITNIGTAHAGMVGGRDAIAVEKRAIFSAFTGRQIAVIPEADRYALFLAEDVAGSVVRYGRRSAGITDVQSRGIEGSQLTAAEGVIRLLIPGAPMVQNALAAITVARLLDVPFAAVRDGIESVLPSFGRCEVIRSRVTVVQDCYNANPESMRAALELLADSRSEGARIAVLGAMKELGDETEAAHREILDFAQTLALDRIVVYGDEFGDATRSRVDGRVDAFGDDEWDQLVDAMRTVRDGDTILLKGSRSVELERLTPILVGEQ